MARKRYSPKYIITKRREAEVHLTQAKIERYHRSMKNVVLLCNYYYPWDLEQAIAAFVEYYNHQRYHEALYNLTPADVYFGREKGVLSRREQIKNKTLSERRIHYFNTMRVYNVQ
jgi:putative transposase